MSKTQDIIGCVYGRLTVIRLSHRGERGAAFFECTCSCGNKKITSRKNLRAGKTKSCGCLGTGGKKGYGESSAHAIYSRYRYRAKAKNIEFSLTEEHFLKLTKEKCTYCGSYPVSVSRGADKNGEYIYNGVDRINSSLGYTDDNVVTCCGTCNKAKSTLSVDSFLSHIGKIYEYTRIKKPLQQSL